MYCKKRNTPNIDKMEVHSELVEPVTPALPLNNVSYWTEDSGYHTSFTPGSLEISDENHQPLNRKICISGQIQVNLTPDTNHHRFGRSLYTSSRREYDTESPVKRRGIKRSYQDDADEVSHSAVSTPTSTIAGGIRKMKVTDSSKPSQSNISTFYVDSGHSDTINIDPYYNNDYTHPLSYPTTPVKKVCKTSCKLSPLRRSNKKINLTMHSLSCEPRGVVEHRSHSKVVRTIKFKPEQKIDIIKMLYQGARVMPPLTTILNYLSNEDIHNFSLVSSVWCQVMNHLGKAKKVEYKNFMKSVKENQENKGKGVCTLKHNDSNQVRSIKEVHNLLNANMIKKIPRSPPGTPKTNKFKKFSQSASLDSRLQLCCVRCNQPAKVTEEVSGEEWAECTSVTCSYQFCRFCKCDRHPGKSCFKYDLEGPSPSKRKKSSCGVATKKSKRNLRRLKF